MIIFGNADKSHLPIHKISLSPDFSNLPDYPSALKWDSLMLNSQALHFSEIVSLITKVERGRPDRRLS